MVRVHPPLPHHRNRLGAGASGAGDGERSPGRHPRSRSPGSVPVEELAGDRLRFRARGRRPVGSRWPFCPWAAPSRGSTVEPPGAHARAGRPDANWRSSSVMYASIGRSSGSNGRGAVATATNRARVGRGAVEPRQRDVMLVDGHAETSKISAVAPGFPEPIVDDSHARVTGNGTKGPEALSWACRSGASAPRPADPATAPPASQPNIGRTICAATTMTSHAIGTAAKNPSAALQPLRRRTVPDPVGWGTTRYVTTVPTTSTSSP